MKALDVCLRRTESEVKNYGRLFRYSDRSFSARRIGYTRVRTSRVLSFSYVLLLVYTVPVVIIQNAGLSRDTVAMKIPFFEVTSFSVFGCRKYSESELP